MFDDPLMRRELSGMARRRQTFVLRTLLGLAMALAVYELWTVTQRRLEYGGVSDLASLGRQIFLVYFAGLMVGLPLAAVMTAADLIPKELRNGSLGLLFLTPLTPWRMAAGKWKAAMAQVLLLLLAGGPVAAVCAYLNGVEAWDLLWGTALPLVSAAYATSLAIFLSTFLRSAAMTAVAAIILLFLGFFIPGTVFIGIHGDFELVGRTHPAFAAMVLVEPRRMPPDLVRYGWVSATAVAAFAAWLLLRLAALRLPGRLHVQAGPGLLTRLMGGLDRFYEAVNVGRFRVLARGGEVWPSRALLWKELRTRATGKLRHATRIALVLLVLSAIPLSGLFGSSRETPAVFLWLFAGLLLLQAVAGGVALFGHEKEGRQWDVLLSTPATAREFVGSKLVGGLAGLAPAAVVSLIYATLLGLTFALGWQLWLAMVLPAGLFVLFAYLVSAWASLRCATHKGAFGLATGVLLGVLLVPPGVLKALGRSSYRAARHGLINWTNPWRYLDWASGQLRYGGHHERVMDSRLADALWIYTAVYAVAAALLVTWMVKRFDRLAGRA